MVRSCRHCRPASCGARTLHARPFRALRCDVMLDSFQTPMTGCCPRTIIIYTMASAISQVKLELVLVPTIASTLIKTPPSYLDRSCPTPSPTHYTSTSTSTSSSRSTVVEALAPTFLAYSTTTIPKINRSSVTSSQCHHATHGGAPTKQHHHLPRQSSTRPRAVQAVLSVPARTLMKTGPRFPTWQSEGGSRIASLNATTVSTQISFC
jgi:hypothetical protein